MPFSITLTLSAEVVEADHVVFYAEAVEKVEDGLGHHGRTTEIVLTIFGSFVLLEIGVAHDGSNETGGVLHAERIGLGIGTVEGKGENFRNLSYEI